ncbi:MAG: ATP-binding cassette domain-containing protein [Actinomycetia bacterium]|nr:ATP-binding cassette domain-containing protein [Actinomycetes bacterium]
MLEARNIGFSYAGGKTILSGFNLSIASAERVALTAPSGHGKTTVCNILAGYLKPQTGAVLLDGQACAARTTKRQPNPVQLVWQHPELAVDPRMRLQASLNEAGGASVELLRRLGIKDAWLSRYPHELSGGELQRICLARALASQPRYLIADEISTMLDAVTQAQIWQVILEEADKRGIGLLFVSHSPALTKHLATRTVEL